MVVALGAESATVAKSAATVVDVVLVELELELEPVEVVDEVLVPLEATGEGVSSSTGASLFICKQAACVTRRAIKIVGNLK